MTTFDDVKKADKKLMATVGKRLVALRKKRGLEIEELCSAAVVKNAALYTYESGRSIPSAFAAMRLAKALNTTVEKLFAPEDADG